MIFFKIAVASLGTGIVRGIDTTEHVIYVATTADASQLESVNCLLAGATVLPESILLEAAAAGRRQRPSRRLDLTATPLPYVSVGPTDPLDMPWQRSHQYGKHSF
jgi:hypothetical protein